MIACWAQHAIIIVPLGRTYIEHLLSLPALSILLFTPVLVTPTVLA